MMAPRHQTPIAPTTDRLARLEKEFASLKSLLPTVIANHEKSVKSNIVINKSHEDIKDKLIDLNGKYDLKANDSHLVSLAQILESTRQSVEASFLDVRALISKLMGSIASLDTRISQLGFYQVNDKNEVQALITTVSNLNKDLRNMIDQEVSSLKTKMIDRFDKLPIAETPVSVQTIHKMIMDEVIPLMQACKVAETRSCDAKMKVDLLHKKIENR